MFDTLKKFKTTIIVILLLAGGYYAFVTFGADSVPEGILTSQNASVDGAAIGQEILGILEDIRTIRLDTSIFSDPAFNSLEDLTEEVLPEPQGRRNPFDPLEFGGNIDGDIAEPKSLLDAITIERNILPEE